jgi:hypothetical protein
MKPFVCVRATGDALSWLQFGIGWLVFVDGLISYNVDFNVDIEGSGASKEFVAYVPGFLASLSLLMCALPFSVRPRDSIARHVHVSYGCRINLVSFDDLNSDGFSDSACPGSCRAKVHLPRTFE